MGRFCLLPCACSLVHLDHPCVSRSHLILRMLLTPSTAAAPAGHGITDLAPFLEGEGPLKKAGFKYDPSRKLITKTF